MKNQSRSDARAKRRSLNDAIGGGMIGGMSHGLGGAVGGATAGGGIGYLESKLGEELVGEDTNSFARGAAGSIPRSALSAFLASKGAGPARDLAMRKLNPGLLEGAGQALKRFLLKNPKLAMALGAGALTAGSTGLGQTFSELGMEDED